MAAPVEKAVSKETARKQILEFVLRGQRYGMDIQSVVEVIASQAATPVFHTPPYVLGVMNLRGVVVCLFETAWFFDLPPAAPTPKTRILVMRSNESGAEQEAGFVVDEVLGARWIETRSLYPAPPTLAGSIREYITGVIEEAGGPLILLSADKIFVSEKVAGL
ncbi:MAG: hypothetical protein A3G34_00500 [Candidatus Lindowbacteria bacterium RIFCSPLOWO2_12_FULL_62_27]|nr:MAG: hypothetical protein A3G34_00500 [Candidatus Lindowbacteria bacterium RIFCSPLOWO2_12_FULL_62_27]